MQDPRTLVGGSLQEGLSVAEREQLEHEWDEDERERQALIESWKEMYRRQGKDPDAVALDWDAVFSERDEA